jgi:hypothetical protein
LVRSTRPGDEQVEVLDHGEDVEGVASRQELAQLGDRGCQFDVEFLVSGRREVGELLVLVAGEPRRRHQDTALTLVPHRAGQELGEPVAPPRKCI